MKINRVIHVWMMRTAGISLVAATLAAGGVGRHDFHTYFWAVIGAFLWAVGVLA